MSKPSNTIVPVRERRCEVPIVDATPPEMYDELARELRIDLDPGITRIGSKRKR